MEIKEYVTKRERKKESHSMLQRADAKVSADVYCI